MIRGASPMGVQRDAKDVDRRLGEFYGNAAHEHGRAAVALDDVPVAVHHDGWVRFVACEHLSERVPRGG